jgi:hypothetical protein
MSNIYVLAEFEHKEIKRLLDEADSVNVWEPTNDTTRIKLLTTAMRRLLEALPVEHV